MVHPVSLSEEITGGAAVNARREEDRLRDLMVRYQQADPAAVEELVGCLSPLLARFFAGSNLNPGGTEDLLQDCWMRIHRARHTYRPAEPLLPWIFAIAKYTRLDAYRLQRRRAAREVLVAETPERIQTSITRATNIMELVERLPQSQRDVLVMLKVAGMSLEDVARATCSTVGAIKQKAHRAYKALRHMLEEQT